MPSIETFLAVVLQPAGDYPMRVRQRCGDNNRLARALLVVDLRLHARWDRRRRWRRCALDRWMDRDPLRSVRLCRWQRSLPYLVTRLLFGPIAAFWHGYVCAVAGFGKTITGDPISCRELGHRFGPDKVVQFLSREAVAAHRLHSLSA